MDKIFETLKQSYFDDVIRIANATLGENYISIEELNGIVNNQNAFGFVLILDNFIAGFCLYNKVDYNKIQEVTHNAIPIDYKEDSFGYIRTIAIDSAFQGRRLGNEIMSHCVSEFHDMGVDKLFTSIWYKPENTANINMVKRSGLKETVLIDDYWLKDSIDNNFTCPICGFPCHCKCLIMTNFI